MRPDRLPPPLRGEKFFRWRGGDMSRLEALSDAVFAFALTLLVVSLEVPRTFDELLAALRLFPAFAASFAILLMCWYFHYLFHRRYGLEDFKTVLLNAILLFVILFYVYPLKFMFVLLLGRWLGPQDVTLPDMIRGAQAAQLFYFYSGGFAVLFAIFALLELHAWNHREALGLNAAERAGCAAMLRSHLISVGVALVSVVCAAAGWFMAAGFVYFVLGPLQGLHGWRSGVQIERLSLRNT